MSGVTARLRGCFTLLIATASAAAQEPVRPIADHHQHFFSPALLEWAKERNPNARRLQPLTARELIAYLDSAGIQKAVVLSTAYQYGRPSLVVENEYDRVKAENDWTSQQVAMYPGRLRAFCGVNPIKPYALEEIARCGRDPELKRGLKLHFGNSDVNLHDSTQVARLRDVFRAANAQGMAIVVHMHASVDQKRPYGASEARIFLDSVLPNAPDVPVQIAHMGGAGAYDTDTEAAIGVIANAITRQDPRVANVYVDMNVGGLANMPYELKARLVARMREIGLQRILFGSDGAIPGFGPREYWATVHALPLTDRELRTIATNVAPYAK